MQDFDVSRIDGHTLRVFLSVCETSSLTQTADVFDLNQSTISHSIEKLRSSVGDPLFVKSGRGIVPTEKALSLIPRIQRILAEIEGLVAPEVYDPFNDFKPVAIAVATPTLMQDMKWVHAELQEFGEKTEFIVRRLAPREQIGEILSGDIADVAIAVSGVNYPPTLNHCAYGYEKLAIFYDPSQRGPVETAADYEQAKHGVVSFGGTKRSEIGKALSNHGLKRTVSLIAPEVSALAQLISGTDLIATMPNRIAETSFRGLAQCPPPIPMPDLKYDLVWHRRYESSGRNIWLRELLLKASALFYGTSEQSGAT